ncbi:MAG: hypothetical protein Q4B70_16610 [Lachnospiraceae bacterium]|nr:hypothetical protein [Lachnospiraceae bacterium]
MDKMKKNQILKRQLIFLLLLVLVGTGGCGSQTKERVTEAEIEGTKNVGEVTNEDAAQSRTGFIYDDIDEKLAQYCDDDGYIAYDENNLEEAANIVYDYATELKESGEIEECTYCEESHTVAFYFDEETIALWIPPVKQTSAGASADEFTVTSVETVDWITDAVVTGVDQLSKFKVSGSQEAANIIYETMEEYTNYQDLTDENWKSMEDIVDWMGSLSENHVRVIFWRGHGTMYKTNKGEKVAAWIVPVKYDDDSEKYQDENASLLRCGEYCGISTSFWEKYCDEVDGTALISGSCSTGADNGETANRLIEKGFSTYVAPDNDIWTTYSDKMLGRISEYLCGKVDGVQYNIVDALLKAREDIGETDIYGTSMVGWSADAQNPFRLVPVSLEVYAQILREKGDGKFDLIYIDGDEMPELVYFEGGAHLDQAELYTIYSGKAVMLGNLGAYGTLAYSEKNNRIFGYTGMEENEELEAEYTYMIENGALAKAPDYKDYTSITTSYPESYEVSEENIQAMLEGTLK